MASDSGARPRPDYRGMPERQVRAVRHRIARDSDFALHALVTLYRELTPLEQFVGDDVGIRDGRGFSPVDQGRMCALYERIEARGFPTAAEYDELRAAMPKYAKQLIWLARERKARRRETRRPGGPGAPGDDMKASA